MTRLGRVVRKAPRAVEACALVTMIELGLRTMTLPRLAQLCGVPMARPGTTPGPPTAQSSRSAGELAPLSRQEQERVRAALWALRRSPFGSTCLRRALASGFVLRRRHPGLVVGVAKRDGVVTAHAWLEIGGHNLDPQGSADFVPLSIDPKVLVR